MTLLTWLFDGNGYRVTALNRGWTAVVMRISWRIQSQVLFFKILHMQSFKFLFLFLGMSASPGIGITDAGER